jgi:hypothetical protein
MGTLLAKNADVLVTMDGRRRELTNAGLFARDGYRAGRRNGRVA